MDKETMYDSENDDEQSFIDLILLREDPILKRFKSQKRNVNVLRRMGDVLAAVVIAGCCYQVYVRSVMREEAQKKAESANETE
ncbi:hypothetical protein ACHQM5_008436 [Ranunculus cassubicifolius]